ncbi:glycosyltransferase [Neptuniibacter halophilus]|uniref:glycosyltransferase n=1 Tax=Neptuniibacter halophilus TaxID=651666 RepID=UPI00257404E0|nr:glycosyltransferase [Neptuniibacter halophilus]
MLRIGLLIDSLIGGGAERVVLNFAGGLADMGHDVHIILVKNEQQHQAASDRYQIHYLSEDGELAENRWQNKKLLAQALRDKVTQIENDGQKFDFFTSNAEDMDRLSGMAALENVYIRYRNSMVKYIENKVGNKTGLKRWIRQWRWTRKFRSIYSGRNIVTVSDALQDELVNQVGIKPKSIRTIYNPFDFDLLRSKAAEPIDPALKPDSPYIIYAAKFENRKRQDLLLKAYAKANIEQKLVLIGGTYTESDKRWYEQMLALIDDLGIKDKVILPGFQSNPYAWVKGAELFAMSSDSEGLPTVLIESLIVGTPVVSTNCPTGPSEILTGEFSRFLSPTDDVDGLAANIRAALEEYPAISDEYLHKFSIRNSLQQYIDHHRQLQG